MLCQLQILFQSVFQKFTKIPSKIFINNQTLEIVAKRENKTKRKEKKKDFVKTMSLDLHMYEKQAKTSTTNMKSYAPILETLVQNTHNKKKKWNVNVHSDISATSAFLS
ncbi:hypothetical protein RB195_009309 [Necator americanus]|uniref:Uncharacterized protein n=1 Tax=Necator americanus TaxID=51031 RepID=A0ABR1CUF3_NECAM